jgi:hypothetical protein
VIILLRVLAAAYGTSRTSGDVLLESARWAKADIDQVAVTDRDLCVRVLRDCVRLED